MTQNNDTIGVGLPKPISEADAKRAFTQDSNLLSTGSVFGAQGSTEMGKITRYSGRGNQQTAIGAHYYGFDHEELGMLLPKSNDQYGLTFFTRPRLRLTYDNIIADRTFALLNNKDENSVYRWVRATLDPLIRQGYHSCPLVDPKQAFIPMLTNALSSLSGWPEISVDTYTSNEGIRKEQWSMADGFAKFHSVFSLNAEFKNMVNNPITELFYYWTQYALMVHEGLMFPHLDSSLENEIDYQTRIYRVVFDSTGNFVQDIAACGIAFPLASNIAAKFDFTDESVFNQGLDVVSIPFQCTGAIYKDPILMKEFNLTVQTFNLGMHDSVREKEYRCLNPNELRLFNHFGYPRIDPFTGAFEWWVSKADYKAVMNAQGYK